MRSLGFVFDFPSIGFFCHTHTGLVFSAVSKSHYTISYSSSTSQPEFIVVDFGIGFNIQSEQAVRNLIGSFPHFLP